ncbi:MAG: HAD-IA family hydrolase [Gammaproteobacteria bacterium]|nr:HAD-IA family hydrolase [Gammaproteobacteria bacterium]
MAVRPDILLFDLGGVLIQLSGQPIRNEWIKGSHTAEQSWKNWLQSDVARAFETGEIDAQTFAERLVQEMSLNISPEMFLAHFTAWPRGLFPGATQLLEALAGKVGLAVFSNSNELHWPRKLDEMGLEDKFEHYFASHLMGLAKPDPAAFERVLERLDTDPGRILFFDDNQLNIDGAREMGLQAELTQGFEAVLDCLRRRELLPAGLECD